MTLSFGRTPDLNNWQLKKIGAGADMGGLFCLPKGCFILLRSGVIFYCFYFGRIRIRNKAVIWYLKSKWMKLHQNLHKIIVAPRQVRGSYRSVNGRAPSWTLQVSPSLKLSKTETKHIIENGIFGCFNVNTKILWVIPDYHQKDNLMALCLRSV